MKLSKIIKKILKEDMGEEPTMWEPTMFQQKPEPKIPLPKVQPKQQAQQNPGARRPPAPPAQTGPTMLNKYDPTTAKNVQNKLMQKIQQIVKYGQGQDTAVEYIGDSSFLGTDHSGQVYFFKDPNGHDQFGDLNKIARLALKQHHG